MLGWFGRFAVLSLGASVAVACAATDAGTTTDSNLVDPALLAEKPWEVLSNKGETFVPNVFYADASQNEQIIPYAIDGHVWIDRMIYPTIGNPNLYTKSDDTDELVVVLRLEDALMTQAPSFSLVPRGQRDLPNGGISINPSSSRMNPEPPEMPAVLKQRHTVRYVFDKTAMAGVGAGLYDLRLQIGDKTELQYNAVRVYDLEPDEYSVLNVTDTQMSVGLLYDARTKDKLSEFVDFVKTSHDPSVANAAFITFNGDLHNGGSPSTLRERAVAWTYNDEAREVLKLLKELPMPIFLTTGNHDGYNSTGQVPGAVEAADAALFDSLESVVGDVEEPAVPNFRWEDYSAFLDRTYQADALGGAHRDVITGSFSRKPGTTYASWNEVPPDQRNTMLYDGFHQWQKTYGPLYHSHRFGKNTYISLNSFELRQHRRAGWGMYTVNYGGSMTPVQMEWLDRELLRANSDGQDIILLAHHDPRGGHRGKDLGYYFEQLDYRSIYQSAFNYLGQQAINPAICMLPDWAITEAQSDTCLHDGLQEWMRPDPDFDGGYSSGIELMKRIASNTKLRTFLLGHTHYNSLEVLQNGDELVPDALPLEANAAQRIASLELANPLRGYSEVQQDGLKVDYDQSALPIGPLERGFDQYASSYPQQIAGWSRRVTAPGARELVVLRMVSNADLSSQTYSGGRHAIGFSGMQITKKYGVPQLNRALFYANVGDGHFEGVASVDIDRTAHLGAHDANNPIGRVYDW